MSDPIDPVPMRAARVYLRVSTDEQDLARQEAIVVSALNGEYSVDKIYLARLK